MTAYPTLGAADALKEFQSTVGRLSSAYRTRMLAFFGEGGSYYINGADVLPPPLTAEEESAILSRFENDRSLADLLIQHNLRLVVYIAKKFESTGIGIEDLISKEPERDWRT